MKGEELEVTEEGNKVVISTENINSLGKIEIDITGMERTIIQYYLFSAYILGYNEIKLIFKEPEIVHFRKHEKHEKLKAVDLISELVTYLIGVEITDQKEKYCIIKDMSDTTTEDFDNVLRRIFLLILTFADDSLEAIKQNNKTGLGHMHRLRYKHIRKFNYFCLRYLNLGCLKDPKKIIPYSQLIIGLKDINGVYRYVAREQSLSKKGLNKKSYEVYGDVNKLLKSFYELFYSFSKEKAFKIIEERAEIFIKINKLSKELPKNDAILFSRLAVILNEIYRLLNPIITIKHFT